MKMGKPKWFCYGLCLFVSIALNLLFSVNLLVGGGRLWLKQQELSWSAKAAAEAEAVASLTCSGHGRAYLDGSMTADGRPVCECYDCYGGLDCSQFISDCSVDADGGEPMFLEPFWMDHAENSAVLISGWHRMSYRYGDKTFMSSELEKYVHKLHSLVGNAITDGRYIVFGVGSSQLLNAAVYALSFNHSSSPANVVASIPFYPTYKTQTEFFNAIDFQFQGDASLWMNVTNNTMNVIEFVTSPNNPDGQLKNTVIGGNVIYDHAYLWPQFTPISAPSDEDLMLFSLSKLTGHAGTRLGWAVIKDKDVYERMLNYILVADLGISKDTQLRALKLLKVVLEGDGKEIFQFGYKKMRDRWERLSSVFSKSKRFSIQQRDPMYCNFYREVRQPSPAYAWVKCEREEDEDCFKVLREGNIVGRERSLFSATPRYVRLTLIKGQDDFELLLQRLTELISQEGDGVKII